MNGEVMANLRQIVTTLNANDNKPFLCTLPPRGNGLNDAALQDLNNRIRAYAADTVNNVTLIDVYAAVADLATGNYRSGLSYDGVNPTEAGAWTIAEYALRTAPNLYGPASLPYLPRTEPDG